LPRLEPKLRPPAVPCEQYRRYDLPGSCSVCQCSIAQNRRQCEGGFRRKFAFYQFGIAIAPPSKGCQTRSGELAFAAIVRDCPPSKSCQTSGLGGKIDSKVWACARPSLSIRGPCPSAVRVCRGPCPSISVHSWFQPG
jgi:hypothetical protein